MSGATSHSGRRTGLTNLSERGEGVRTLMALAGHSNMATTQRYIDLRPAVIKPTLEMVGARFVRKLRKFKVFASRY